MWISLVDWGFQHLCEQDLAPFSQRPRSYCRTMPHGPCPLQGPVTSSERTTFKITARLPSGDLGKAPGSVPSPLPRASPEGHRKAQARPVCIATLQIWMQTLDLLAGTVNIKQTQ